VLPPYLTEIESVITTTASTANIMENYQSIWLAASSYDESPFSILLTSLSYTVATALGVFLIGVLTEALKGPPTSAIIAGERAKYTVGDSLADAAKRLISLSYTAATVLGTFFLWVLKGSPSSSINVDMKQMIEKDEAKRREAQIIQDAINRAREEEARRKAEAEAEARRKAEEETARLNKELEDRRKAIEEEKRKKREKLRKILLERRAKKREEAIKVFIVRALPIMMGRSYVGSFF